MIAHTYIMRMNDLRQYRACAYRNLELIPKPRQVVAEVSSLHQLLAPAGKLRNDSTCLQHNRQWQQLIIHSEQYTRTSTSILI